MMYDAEFGLCPLMRSEDFDDFFQELDRMSEGWFVDKYLTVHAEFDYSRTRPEALKALVDAYPEMILDSCIPEL